MPDKLKTDLSFLLDTTKAYKSNGWNIGRARLFRAFLLSNYKKSRKPDMNVISQKLKQKGFKISNHGLKSFQVELRKSAKHGLGVRQMFLKGRPYKKPSYNKA